MQLLEVLRGRTDEELQKRGIFEFGAVIDALETWLAGDGGEGLQRDFGCRRGLVFEIDAGFQEKCCYFCYGRHCEFVGLLKGQVMLERELIPL